MSEQKDVQIKKINVVLGHRFQKDKNLLSRCPAEVLSKILRCVVCEMETTPDVYGSCERNGHVICKSCYTAYLKEMDGDENWVICPYLNDKAVMCGKKFVQWNFLKGIRPYWEFYLSRCKFSCSSSVYGCSMTGFGFNIVEHESSDCIFSQFTRCEYEGKKSSHVCNGRFHSGLEYLKHFVEIHEVQNTISSCFTEDIKLKKNELRLEPSSTVFDDGDRIFFGMYSYKPERHCFVVVEEFDKWLRIWAVEADSSVDPKELMPISITVPASSPAEGWIRSKHQFHAVVAPFGSFKSCAYDSDTFEFFDVPKTFLKKFLREDEEGKWIKVFFKIGAEPVDEEQITAAVDKKLEKPNPVNNVMKSYHAENKDCNCVDCVFTNYYYNSKLN